MMNYCPRRRTGFGELLESTASLNANNVYTINVQTNELFQPSDAAVTTKLTNGWTGKYVDIISVGRPYFSGRFQIILKPKKDLKYLSLNQFIIQDLVNLGAEKASVVSIDSGKTATTNVGGAQGAVQSVVQETSNIAASAMKPLIPWAIGAVGLLIAYSWWKVGGLDEVLRPKQPAGVGRNNYRSVRT